MASRKLDKYSSLVFRILLVLGIVLHSLLSIRFFESRIFFDMFSLMFLVYAFSWIIAVEIFKRNFGIKHFGIIASILVLGVVLLLIFPISAFFTSILRIENVLLDFLVAVNYGDFLLFCLFGGMVFLTVGVCGVGSRYFRDGSSVFSLIVVLVIPSIIWSLLFWFTCSLTVTV